MLENEFLTKEEIDSLLENANVIYEGKPSGSNDGLNKDSKTSLQQTNVFLKKEGLSIQQKQNIELLLDVDAEITVELGRTHMKIKDILSLGEGSIIELNKSANEPVSLIVNDQIFAKGEVVIIDENFGTRITYILNTKEQLLNDLL